MQKEWPFEVAGTALAAVRFDRPLAHWRLKIVETGEVLEAGAGGFKTGSRPKMKQSVEDFFERICKGDPADFRKRMGLPSHLPSQAPTSTTESSADPNAMGVSAPEGEREMGTGSNDADEIERLRAKVKQADTHRETIGRLLADAVDTAIANGANSVSMPDEYVALAVWLCEE